MPISATEVEKVALLARLKLSPDEVASYTEDLGKIVGYVDQLCQVATDGVEPMVHAIELRNVVTGDQVRPSLPRGEALANAPHHNDQGYLVPAVLGE